MANRFKGSGPDPPEVGGRWCPKTLLGLCPPTPGTWHCGGVEPLLHGSVAGGRWACPLILTLCLSPLIYEKELTMPTCWAVL